MHRLPRLLRRALLVVVLALAVGALDACTNGTEESSAGADPSPTATSTDPPVRVVARVTRVAGHLPDSRRAQLEARTRRIVQAYVDSALLGSDPHPGFYGFTAGAKRLAKHDEQVLTLRGVPSDADVSPRRVAAYVAVLAPHDHVVGATARIEVDLRVTHHGSTRLVRLTGRLLLTPSKKGVRVFGYDLQRAGEGLS